MCLCDSTSDLLVTDCQLQGWINQDSTAIGNSDGFFKEVDLERYGNN